MHVTKGLIFGVLGALLIGGAEAMGEAAFAQTLGKKAGIDDSPLTVPHGNVGDRVAYSSFARDLPTEPWRLIGNWSFQVDRLGEAADLAGNEHPSLTIISSPTADERRNGFLGLTQVTNAEVVTRQIALAGRDTVSWTLDWKGSFNADLLFSGKGDGGRTDYGPKWRAISDVGNYAPNSDVDFQKFLPIVYQGHTLRIGDPPEALREVVLDWELSARDLFEGAFGFPKFDYSAKVADRRIVDGHESYLLRSQGCFVFMHIEGTWTLTMQPYLDGVPFMHGEVLPEKEICFEHDAWLANDVPYPVMLEERVKTDGSWTWHRREALVGFEPGAEPIPWGEPHGPLWYPLEIKGVERSGPTVRHPLDGSLNLLPLSLAQAMQTAERGPLPLPQFSLWRAQHPAAMLIGFHASPESGASFRWNLVYGDPIGSAFVIDVDKTATEPPRAREVGEFTIPKFRLADFPPDQVSLASAGKLWRERFVVADTGPLNYARWGYCYGYSGTSGDPDKRPTPFCGRVEECRPPSPDYQCKPGVRDWSGGILIIGHTAYDGVPDGADAVRGPQPAHSEAQFWAPDPSVIRTMQARSQREFMPLAATVKVPGEPQAMPAPDFQLQPPALSKTLLVSASLAALWLALYFYPLLKWTAAQAAGVVPGYAKTERGQVLAHKTREVLANAIRSDPGITPPQLHALVGGSWMTTVYHLRQLEKNKIVSSLVDGRHKHFFPTDTVNWNDRGRIVALRNERTKELYQILQIEPGLDRQGLASRLQISRPATYWHIDRLERSGLVGRDKVGRRTRFFAVGPETAPARLSAKESMEIA